MSSELDRPALHQAIPPVSATAVVVDLRNFTPNLNAAGVDASGVNVFCRFLGGLYGFCLDAALMAMSREDREDPPVYMGSTGDGVIMVFLDPEWHYGHGYLASLILQVTLGRMCRSYNLSSLHNTQVPHTGFGIGVESGKVCRVSAERNDGKVIVDTYIGDCINVASRAQGVSKHLHRADTIVCRRVNQLLCETLLGEDYDALLALEPDADDAECLESEHRLRDLNEELCLAFLHLHQLRGVDRPMTLFRVSERAAQPGNPRFEGLIEQLIRGDAEHLKQVMAIIRG